MLFLVNDPDVPLDGKHHQGSAAWPESVSLISCPPPRIVQRQANKRQQEDLEVNLRVIRKH